jgi:sensor histidine kinase YesM
MLVFGVWYYFRHQDYDSGSQAMKITLLKVTDLALLIYLTNYLLIPRLLYKKKYALFVASFVLMILLSSTTKLYLTSVILETPELFTFSGNMKTRLYDNVIPHFFLVIAGAAIQLMLDYGKMQQRLAEVAKEKAETELNFLKSQINPHFLFNSLNAVYFLINKENAEARNALHKFSDMLRYQLYEMNGDKIPIEKEIRYLRDYVDLQHLRKDEKYSVEFNSDPAVKGFLIEPLLLVPFVENAFKHVSHHPDSLNFIRLNMTRVNGVFHFSIENSKEKKTADPKNGGIGLVNVKRRLELLYPGKYDLHINEIENTFHVKLNLYLS